MPLDLTIRGTVRVDGQPVEGQDVLVISSGVDALLGACTTGTAGEFSCAATPPDNASSVVILAKIKAGVITVVNEVVHLPQSVPLDINVESSTRFFRIDGRITSNVGRPDFLNVFLDPVSIEGVPESMGRFFKQKSQGVFDNHFVYTPIKGESFTFRVAPGRYNLGGDYLVLERPMLVNKSFQNYLVDKITVGSDGAALPGNPYSGFTLQVAGDSTVNLHLRVVEDQEL